VRDYEGNEYHGTVFYETAQFKLWEINKLKVIYIIKIII
jgi:hypothetical protein